MDMDCYITYNSSRNDQSNNLRKEGYIGIPENKWTHLKCINTNETLSKTIDYDLLLFLPKSIKQQSKSIKNIQS